jgi:hypothetical protein
MTMFKRRNGLGYIPGPRPRLPDEPEPGMLRTIVWLVLIFAAIAFVLLFRKQHGA